MPPAPSSPSNKADLYATTAAFRAALGTVWGFDPQGVAYLPRSWSWNPLAAINTMEDADRLARHSLTVIR